MLRLFGAQVVCDLWRCSPAVVPRVTSGNVRDRVCVFSSHHRAAVSARLLNTGNPVRKDSTQPKTEQTEPIDLNKWKHVMRSQAALDEKQQVNDNDDDDDNDHDEEEAKAGDETIRGPGGDLKDSPNLEATRELVTMWRLAGKLVPEEMTDEEVQALAELTTKSAKKKYLKYLAIKEGHRKARKEKQQQRRVEREAVLEKRELETEGGDQREQEMKNTFLLQFWSRSLDKLLAWRSAQAMVFGQPLVFDMSYESNMSRREVDNTVSQLMEVEGWNRRATEPFHLHFCNLQQGGAYKQELLKRYGAEAWDRLLITSTDRQHIDLFPREHLVYLTADSPNVLRTFDHSKVYIVGALVDRSIQSGLSLANAKRLKLATARLPLDEFLHWEMGAKNLTLDQMIRILLTLKDTGKWEEAFEFVPKRKHDGFFQPQIQRQVFNKDRRFTHPRPGQVSDKSSRFGESNSGRTFRSGAQSLSSSYRDSGFTGVAREKSRGGAGLSADGEHQRTSFKGKMEGKTGASRNKKMWWESE